MKRSTLVCAVTMGAIGLVGGATAMAQNPVPTTHDSAYSVQKAASTHLASARPETPQSPKPKPKTH